MKIDGPKFRLWFDPDIDDEEWGEAAHAICKIIILGKPQSPRLAAPLILGDESLQDSAIAYFVKQLRELGIST